MLVAMAVLWWLLSGALAYAEELWIYGARAGALPVTQITSVAALDDDTVALGGFNGEVWSIHVPTMQRRAIYLADTRRAQSALRVRDGQLFWVDERAPQKKLLRWSQSADAVTEVAAFSGCITARDLLRVPGRWLVACSDSHNIVAIDDDGSSTVFEALRPGAGYCQARRGTFYGPFGLDQTPTNDLLIGHCEMIVSYTREQRVAGLPWQRTMISRTAVGQRATDVAMGATRPRVDGNTLFIGTVGGVVAVDLRTGLISDIYPSPGDAYDQAGGGFGVHFDVTPTYIFAAGRASLVRINRRDAVPPTRTPTQQATPTAAHTPTPLVRQACNLAQQLADLLCSPR